MARAMGAEKGSEPPVARMLRFFWRWERTTRNALARLDSAILADIGVARSEIPAIAREAARNPTFTGTRRSLWTD